MKKNIHIILMAGGTGTRFWPYSRKNKPKQFLDLFNTGESLLQTTFNRFLNFTTKENIWIVTSAIYKDIINEQLPNLNSDQILLEPSKRNTAPCIAYAVFKINKIDPNAIIVVTPSDAAIFDDSKFNDSINTSINSAKNNNQLITIGIKPHKPEVGYGYIQFEESNAKVKKVKTFTEKPNIELAKQFVDSGEFVWNAGIFVFSIKSIIEAFETLQPDISNLFKNGNDVYFTDKETVFIDKVYSECKSISIDYAIMEKADNVFVVLGYFKWSDLGSWTALHELSDKDKNNNVGCKNAILYDCENNILMTEKEKLVVLSNLDGYLIADFNDVLLICKKDDSEKFKNFVNEVNTLKGSQFI